MCTSGGGLGVTSLAVGWLWFGLVFVLTTEAFTASGRGSGRSTGGDGLMCMYLYAILVLNVAAVVVQLVSVR